MIFFSGFSLENEEILFKEYLSNNDYTVAGFSKGAIKAFDYVLKTTKRVDKLQLFSPVFFQIKSEKFKKLQLLHYKKDKMKYEENFLKNIAYPAKIDMKKFYKEDNYDNLKELLYYVWDEKKLNELIAKGVDIEVYLGEKDIIIDSNKAYEFFVKFARVYYIKGVGHIL